jgi:radical SAM-linked protein
MRRAHLPISYSKGFHPHPRINQACPLPLGITSQGEILDFWLSEESDLGNIQILLEQSVHPGIEILEIEKISLKAPALQTQVIASEYSITIVDPMNQADSDHLRNCLQKMMAEESLMRQRRGKEYDLKPLIQDIRLYPPNDNIQSRLRVILSQRQGATGRPEEVADALGLNLSNIRIERTKLLLTSENDS